MRDFWRHEIRVEDYLEPESGRPYPVCIDGAHACPPEACGGPGGYAERRQEACGFAAVDDLATLADLLEAAMVNGQADLLDASQRGWEAQEVVDRIRARQPFLTDTFSCSAVNARLRQGDHHVLRHQQLW